MRSTLVRAVGESRARELVLLGAPFTVQDATAWGIAGHVVQPDEVSGAAHALDTRLATGPTAAFAESQQLLARAGDPRTDLLGPAVRVPEAGRTFGRYPGGASSLR